MKNLNIKIYDKNDYNRWNDFISQAKNATFLFHRDFMEYHSDRFEDFSLIVLDGQKWLAVLPANKVQDTIYSHQGLTYGGLIYGESLKLAAVIEVFNCILNFLKANHFKKFHIKSIPSIYHQKPAEELQYALFLVKAQLVRRDTLAVLDLTQKNIQSKLRKRSIQKGLLNDFVIKEVSDFDAFWNDVLIPNLNLKFQSNPIHTLNEITKLKGLFPLNIRQFNVYQNGEIVAGTTIFETQTTAHCQYISGKADQIDFGGLDVLFQYLIVAVFKNKRFFDLGTSNGNPGNSLNPGLSYWKESFGASTIVHDFYEVEL